MGKIKIGQFIIGVAFFILLTIIVWQVSGISTGAEPLSEADAREIAADRYSGEIMDVVLENDIYSVMIQLETGMYDLKIDRSSGDVIGITRREPEKSVNELSEADIKEIVLRQQKGEIKKLLKRKDDDHVYYDAVVEDDHNKTTIILNAETGEVIDLTVERLAPLNETAKILTESEAIKIALDTVSGKVDDVDIEQLGGVTFYLVEIEHSDDQEAIIQVNAITGEVLSITWDD